MFYILIILGSILIGLGMYKNKISEDDRLFEDVYDHMPEYSWKEELEELRDRVNRLEQDVSTNKLSFDDFLSYETRKKSKEVQIPKEHEDISNNAQEKLQLLREYEREGFSVDEICILLDMNKGEVLLLKSLYNNQ